MVALAFQALLSGSSLPSMVGAYWWTPYFEFSGVMHPAVSHFPIALLTVAGLIEGWSILRRHKKPSQSTLVCLYIGTVAAVVATVLGWADADRMGYSNGETINLHRWLGIAVAILAVISLVLSLFYRREGTSRKIVWSYRGSVLASAALVGLVGSLGGKLVHGTSYYEEAWAALAEETRDTVDLAKNAAKDGVDAAEDAVDRTAGALKSVPALVQATATTDAGPAAPQADGVATTQPATTQPAPTPTTNPAAGVATTGAEPAPATTRQAAAVAVPAAAQVGGEFGGGRIDFVRDIRPIFEAACVKCHNDKKTKGDYRMDSMEHLFAAGETGKPPVLPGKSDESLLVKVIEGKGEFEDLLMPPKGDPLSFQQIALIRRWIDEGAQPSAPQ